MKPLVDKQYQLKKFSGKGGWTYAEIPEIPQDKTQPFGWRNVRGSVDGVDLGQFRLMPMGNEKLFLPLRADIRKKIKKKEGDFVHIVLYPDNGHVAVPEEVMVCLQDEPKALAFFNNLRESEKKAYLQWVKAAKNEHQKVERIATMINRLLDGLR